MIWWWHFIQYKIGRKWNSQALTVWPGNTGIGKKILNLSIWSFFTNHRLLLSIADLVPFNLVDLPISVVIHHGIFISPFTCLSKGLPTHHVTFKRQQRPKQQQEKYPGRSFFDFRVRTPTSIEISEHCERQALTDGRTNHDFSRSTRFSPRFFFFEKATVPDYDLSFPVFIFRRFWCVFVSRRSFLIPLFSGNHYFLVWFIGAKTLGVCTAKGGARSIR